MRLGRFAPIFCLMVVAATAVSALVDPLRDGLSAAHLQAGGLLTFTSAVLLVWLILDSPPKERAFAKAALALMLAGAAAWSTVVWPSFWASLGLDDCISNCIRPEHDVARLDMMQGKWTIAIVNACAALLVLAAILPRQHHAPRD